MKTIHNYRDLALKQLSILYWSERQYATYLKVFSHKSHVAQLKVLLFDISQNAEVKAELLQQAMEELDYKPTHTSTEGMNGIFKEGFKLISQDEHPSLVDATIIHSLILASHYKLGNFKTLLLYFRSLDFDPQAEMMEQIIALEESVLHKLNQMIKEEFVMNVFKPQLKSSLAY